MTTTTTTTPATATAKTPGLDRIAVHARLTALAVNIREAEREAQILIQAAKPLEAQDNPVASLNAAYWAVYNMAGDILAANETGAAVTSPPVPTPAPSPETVDFVGREKTSEVLFGLAKRTSTLQQSIAHYVNTSINLTHPELNQSLVTVIGALVAMAQETMVRGVPAYVNKTTIPAIPSSQHEATTIPKDAPAEIVNGFTKVQARLSLFWHRLPASVLTAHAADYAAADAALAGARERIAKIIPHIAAAAA